MKIYQNKSRLKVVLIVLALLIGTASLLYTNHLIGKLAEREQKLILLYARGLEFVVNTSDADNENISFIFNEIIEANKSIPVILADENHQPNQQKNVEIPTRHQTADARQQYLTECIAEMAAQYPPIEVVGPGFRNYIYYQDSRLITQLKYYPFVQLSAIGLFGLLAYLALSYSRRMEQDRVWVGLAKETAHQLGTPLSSLMAWAAYLRADERFADDSFVDEIEKDIDRLETVTARFSQIGSTPVLKSEEISTLVRHTMDYLRQRISKKVVVKVDDKLPAGTRAQLNRALFEWVIENVSKNAVDAMRGRGQLTVSLREAPENRLHIDISDTGKGIQKREINKVFEPGFTTKKRGWGLGLTLVRRIVSEYHDGRVFVLRSAPGQGTTFRIVLPSETQPIVPALSEMAATS